MMKDLPLLAMPIAWSSVGGEGTTRFHFKDNHGDGEFILEREVWDDPESPWVFRCVCRFGTPPPGGVVMTAPYASGDPTRSWPEPPPNINEPEKALLGLATPESFDNIDTHHWIRNPKTGLYTTLHGVKPGARPPEPDAGAIFAIMRATSKTWSREASAWTRYPGELLIQPDPAARWSQGYLLSTEPVNEWDGGTGEGAINYDPTTDTFVEHFTGKTVVAIPDAFGETFRARIGRAECPAAIFDTAPVFTWTPAPSDTSYVFDPTVHGMRPGEVYGNTNETAVWGTSNTILQMSVTISPFDGSWHLIALQKKPNTGQGIENASAGIGHWYSHDRGFTWVADSRNPLITWASLGFWDNGIANKLNSSHICWDEVHPGGWLVHWGNNDGQNKLGTRCYFHRFELDAGGGGTTVYRAPRVKAARAPTRFRSRL